MISQVTNLKLPKEKLEDLYEQIALELIELRETDTARAMLRQTQVLSNMQQHKPERYERLEQLCSRPYLDARELYGGTTREKRRSQLAQSLSAEALTVPPSRLMALIGQALKWQQQQGLLPAGTAFDLFRGTAAGLRDTEDMCPTELECTIRFGAKTHPESATFCPDGQYLVTGSVDGFIEVWDFATGRLRTDLPYQAEERFMMHDTAVLCLAFSRDSELLASGDQSGIIKVWRVRTGQCLRRFDGAHSQGITTLSFSKDASHVLSGSYDGLLRVHGIKSGKMLKEFRGHTSYINAAVYMGDTIVSASSDTTLRIWNTKSCECTFVFRPPQETSASEAPVNCVVVNPQHNEQVLVCTRSPTLYMMTVQGQVVKSYSVHEKGSTTATPVDFVTCIMSPRGEYIYAFADDGMLYCFETSSGKVEHSMKVTEKGPIGLVHHPHRNLLGAFSQEGAVKIYKAT